MDKIEQINKCCISIKKEIEQFECVLKELINKDKNFLTDDLNSFLFNNPKRLRVRFVFLFARLFNINSPLVLKIALIVELIHSASLIHDDIIDCDELRRNNPTFYKKYGSKTAVLEGDLLLSEALIQISETNSKIAQIFSTRIKKTILGEILQNENLDKVPDIKTYLDKTFNKTANLFCAGVEALFALGEFDDDIKSNALDFMSNYSMAFQIKNDIDNFKHTNSDIKNGNYTLPMIYFDIDKAEKKVSEYKNLALDNLKKIKKDTNSLLNLTEISLRS